MKILIYLMAVLLSVLVYSEEKDVSMIKLMFALQINDTRTYQQYRKDIAPLMEKLGVEVLEEYDIARVIQTQSVEAEVNRVAVFTFPSEMVKAQFFSDPQYLAAKPLFESSTSNFRKLIE